MADHVLAVDAGAGDLDIRGLNGLVAGLICGGEADLQAVARAHMVKRHRRGVEQFGSSLGS